MDPSRIKKHEDFQNKLCPHRTLNDYGWDYFINLVKAKYKAMYEKEAESMTTAERKEFDELTSKVKKLEETLAKYEEYRVYDNSAIRWAYIDGNLPEFAAPTIKKLVNKGYLKGNGKNSLELSYLFMRILVILDRAGAFGK
jgi:N-acetylmuramoyl-L-alanine amidase CwlA